ncbi:hypothetical protein LCGC14_2108030, partial [marine sediment metagenome]
IYIETGMYYHNEGDLRWSSEISDRMNYVFNVDEIEEFSSRTEAEEKAFEKAFEILENKL